MLTIVTLDDLEAARGAGATVIDVRDHDEYVAGHVPGATHLPWGEVSARLGELPTDAPVYLVCQSGNRSSKAAQVLDQAGLDARNVDGGTSAWVQSGRPVETGSAPTL